MNIRSIVHTSAILCILSISLHASIILIDNGGVITHTNTYAALKELGLHNIIYYALILKKDPRTIQNHLLARFYDFLELAANTHNVQCPNAKPHELPRDEYGTIFPRLMRKWQDGTMSCKAIRELINKTIEDNSHWFVHTVEKKLIANMSAMIFTPEIFLKTRKIDPHAVNFIKECKKHGHGVYLFSNWDHDSFELFQQQYADLCAFFDGTVTSGQEHEAKPNPAIYKIMLEKYNLDPSDCFFFDNQKENIIAARECGINGILCTHPSVLTVDQLPKKTELFHTK